MKEEKKDGKFELTDRTHQKTKRKTDKGKGACPTSLLVLSPLSTDGWITVDTNLYWIENDQTDVTPTVCSQGLHETISLKNTQYIEIVKKPGNVLENLSLTVKHRLQNIQHEDWCWCKNFPWKDCNVVSDGALLTRMASPSCLSLLHHWQLQNRIRGRSDIRTVGTPLDGSETPGQHVSSHALFKLWSSQTHLIFLTVVNPF